MRTLRYGLTLTLLVVAFAVTAQKNDRTSAIMAYKEWLENKDKSTDEAKEDLLEAKKFIDNAYNAKDDRWDGTQDAKTLYYRGDIYMAFQMYATDESMKDYPLMEMMKTGMEMYKAHLDLEDKRSKDDFTKEIKRKLAIMRDQAAQMATNMYNQQNYEMALTSYSGAAELLKMAGMIDTASYFNGGLCASMLEKWETAAEYFEICAENGFGEALSYSKWGEALYKQGKEDEALMALKKGREKYPKNPDLYITEANHYLLKSGDLAAKLKAVEEDTTMAEDKKTAKINELKPKVEKAQKKAESALNQAIDADPKNVSVYFAVGAIQSETGNTEGAEASYKKALEIQPDYFDALYGLGALYFNKGVELNAELNDIAAQRLYDEKKKEQEEWFKKAIPYLEKAKDVNPKDKPTLHALWKAYLQLKMNDKAAEVRDLLKN